tara:strand:+ start:719 stop:1555 length:837 start_codon:yes stop_codon:yes gene_type:complete
MWPNQPDKFESFVKPREGGEGEGSYHFLFVGQELVCHLKDGFLLPITSEDLRWMNLTLSHKHYLGLYDEKACYVAEALGDIPDGYSLENLFSFLGRTGPEVFYLAGRAKQILDWDKTNMFCGRCGADMRHHDIDRAKVCDRCSYIVYPRLSPSIIVLVTKGEKMLLARNANWQNGFFSTLAGFVEPGESIEQTVHREVQEEVGLKIKDLQYRGSQSWPFPNSLMLGFHAAYDAGSIEYRDKEIAEARWFGADDLPNLPPGTAISRWLIDDFLNTLSEN